jgi:hypothetical protein
VFGLRLVTSLATDRDWLTPDIFEIKIDMEHKEASTILIKLLGKNQLDDEEREAILTAIGVLAWTSLSKSKIKAMRDKRERLKNGNGRT